MNTEMIEQARQLLAENNHEALRVLPLSRWEIRTFILPLARRKLGELAPVKAPGLSSNWCGRGQMSRYAL